MSERERWIGVVLESMFATWGLMADSVEGGQAIRRDGLLAAVVPATPERSVINSVVYRDRSTLLDSLEELAEAYERSGVRAWTVWVPEVDRGAAEALESAGHVLDAEPRAMGLELAGAAEPQPQSPVLELRRDCDLATVGRLNDAAYGYDGDLERVITAMPGEGVHSYCIDVEGETASVMVTIDSGEDTEIAWVATSEAARGRGLATALMRAALNDARERGQRTATLQATKRGTPVYSRLGFQDFGALQMWERRVGAG